jgi:hypothetical protein
MDKIEIPISRKKISILLIATVLFIIFGILFIITPETFITIMFRNPQIIRLVGIAAVLFFGAAGIYGFKKLFDNSMGLIIDENGITDNTNASSIGLIDWADIIKIKTEQVMSTKFLLIYTTNPNKYLDRAKGFRQKLMKGNLKVYGTPISITSNTLRYNFDDLERLINKNLQGKNNMPKC